MHFGFNVFFSVYCFVTDGDTVRLIVCVYAKSNLLANNIILVFCVLIFFDITYFFISLNVAQAFNVFMFTAIYY